MPDEATLKSRALELIGTARQLLGDLSLVARHRRRPKDFIRKRTYQFQVLMLLILQKSLKSLQLRLHEFARDWAALVAPAPSGTPGAFTHARAKLLPSAFVELNQKAVLATVYGPEWAGLVKRWRGHRLL